MSKTPPTPDETRRAEEIVRRVYAGLDAGVTPRGNILIGEIAAALSTATARYREALQDAHVALTDIAAGRGAYSADQYQFACNVIEEAKATAAAAASRAGTVLAQTTPPAATADTDKE